MVIKAIKSAAPAAGFQLILRWRPDAWVPGTWLPDAWADPQPTTPPSPPPPNPSVPSVGVTLASSHPKVFRPEAALQFGCVYFRTTRKGKSFNHIAVSNGAGADSKQGDMKISLGAGQPMVACLARRTIA